MSAGDCNRRLCDYKGCQFPPDCIDPAFDPKFDPRRKKKSIPMSPAMSYDYQKEKKKILTEEGLTLFLKIRDKVHATISTSGAITMGAAINGIPGEVWTMMACVDRLVELKEIKEVTDSNYRTQDRVFVKG